MFENSDNLAEVREITSSTNCLSYQKYPSINWYKKDEYCDKDLYKSLFQKEYVDSYSTPNVDIRSYDPNYDLNYDHKGDYYSEYFKKIQSQSKQEELEKTLPNKPINHPPKKVREVNRFTDFLKDV